MSNLLMQRCIKIHNRIDIRYWISQSIGFRNCDNFSVLMSSFLALATKKTKHFIIYQITLIIVYALLIMFDSMFVCLFVCLFDFIHIIQPSFETMALTIFSSCDYLKKKRNRFHIKKEKYMSLFCFSLRFIIKNWKSNNY